MIFRTDKAKNSLLAFDYFTLFINIPFYHVYCCRLPFLMSILSEYEKTLRLFKKMLRYSCFFFLSSENRTEQSMFLSYKEKEKLFLIRDLRYFC